MTTFVTPMPWAANLQHPYYATTETYARAAEWLKDCADVADWGGAAGFFGQFLPAHVRYQVVDGTAQHADQTLANLADYRQSSAGILLRHVLEVNHQWLDILQNAMAAFTARMVVVTYTGPAPRTAVLKMKSGWPIYQFSLEELRHEMAPFLMYDEPVQTSHPEHVFYLERRRP